MAANPTLLLTIRTLRQQGEKILGNRWIPFIDYLRNELRTQGVEAESSNDELIVLTFPQGLAAFPVLLIALENCKKEHAWQAASGPCPLQIIFDLLPYVDSEIADRLPGSALFDTLHQEVIYISPDLEEKWPGLISGFDNFPGHKITSDGSGLSRILFFDHDIGKRPKLLAFRALPVSGTGPECFYCGMTSHSPALCPSRSLTMSTWGLADVGYLTFAELNNVYKAIFPEHPTLVAELTAGVNPTQIRKSAKLLTFIAYFDIGVVFQPRFLWNFAFSGYSQWNSLYLSDRIKIDNRNLHLGLDCLRVGQYEQALEILEKELKRKDGDRFAANIALALCSLELNRPSDMIRYLNESRNLAHQTREIVYCNLLLSRYNELAKDYWNAKEAVANALRADYDCLDVQYRRIQLSVREGLSDREFKQLRTLIVGQKEIFIKALLDPHLTPIQGLIEDILSQQHGIIAVDAEKNIDIARQEALALEVWLAEDDPRREEHKASLEQLEKQLGRASYFDLLDVSERSSGLSSTCRRLRKDKSDRLNQELEHLARRLGGYITFWKDYPYKSLFKQFQDSLLAATKKCQRARLLLKEERPETTKKAIALARQLDEEIVLINKEYSRLLWVRTSLNGFKLFAKRLLISEFTLLTLLALLFPLLASTLGNTPSFNWLAELSANKQAQKNFFVIAGLIVAPFISLAWTMLDLQKKQ
jgi:hypothetical protein